jgi:adenosylhomocysteine nucleosidase
MNNSVTRLVISVFVLGLGFVFAQKLDETPRLAVMSAYEPEWQVLLGTIETEETFNINGYDYTIGKLAGNDVVLFLTGVSMVNATMTSQIALERFNITGIIFSGIAGGVNPDLNIGDVTVAEQWGQYQEMLYGRENPDGTFLIPEWAETPFPPYGYMFPQNVEVRTAEKPEIEYRFWFAVDEAMLETAKSIADTVTLDKCNAENLCLSHDPKIVIGGNGVSGQTFVDNAAFREWTFETFEAQVLDMETAAVAMVAYQNSVPFIAFRSLSDLAGGGPGENEIGTFFGIASDNSAKVMLAFLEAWSMRE